MIIRIYHARVRPGKEADFERLARADALPLMKNQTGLLEVRLGQGVGQPAEFVIVSVWRDLDAMKAFSGEDWQQPVVLHPGAGVLAEASVEHYFGLDA